MPGALGTDTAGSVRIPAALCGVTGIRPSTGRVPNRGVIPVSWTYDTVGPLAHTAEDCALLLDAIGGPEPGDASTTSVAAEPCVPGLEDGVEGLRIGVVAHLVEDVPLDPRVGAAVEEAIAELGRLGARVERVEAPFLRRAEAAQQLVMLPEAAEAHLPWLRTRLADYGPDVRARLLAGLLLPASAPITGQRARRALAEEARPLFDRFDLLAAPEMPIVAPRIGEDPVDVGGQAAPVPPLADPVQLPLELPRAADGERPLRARRRAAGRARADGQAPRRGDGAPRGARLPAGHRLARAPAAASRLTMRRGPSYTPRSPRRKEGPGCPC